MLYWSIYSSLGIHHYPWCKLWQIFLQSPGIKQELCNVPKLCWWFSKIWCPKNFSWEILHRLVVHSVFSLCLSQGQGFSGYCTFVHTHTLTELLLKISFKKWNAGKRVCLTQKKYFKHINIIIKKKAFESTNHLFLSYN